VNGEYVESTKEQQEADQIKKAVDTLPWHWNQILFGLRDSWEYHVIGFAESMELCAMVKSIFWIIQN